MSPVARWACHGQKPAPFCPYCAACCRCSLSPSRFTKRPRARTAPRTVDLRRHDRRLGAARRLRHALVRRHAGRDPARRPSPHRQPVLCTVSSVRSKCLAKCARVTLTHVLANRPNVGGPDLDHDALIWSRLRQRPLVLDKG
jgi:hypothetical protein